MRAQTRSIETVQAGADEGNREPLLGSDAGSGTTPARLRCLVCRHGELERIQRTRYQDILRCIRCGFVFGSPVYSREELLAYADTTFNGEGFFETAGFFDVRLRGRTNTRLLRQYQGGLEWIARFVPSGSLLDVGCGEPLFLDLARSAGYVVEGLDTVSGAASVARDEFGIHVRTEAFDRCELPGASVDVITMWDFLEHVPDPIATLKQARRLLSHNGVLFVSAPNYCSVLHDVARLVAKLPVASIQNVMDKLYHFSHVCVWSPRSIEKALSLTGFDTLARGLASPDLSRYRLTAPVRAGLTAIDWIGRLTARRSRLWVLAAPTT